MVTARAGDYPGRDPWSQRPYCPVDRSHRPWTKLDYDIDRRNSLTVELTHNRRDQLMIWATGPSSCLIHEQLAAEMDKRGFTGYQLVPSEMRFRDGVVSREYHRFVVTGWGGLARPESGVRLMRECSGCTLRVYSQLEDPRQMIDEQQWTGEDFFMVWPLNFHTLITARVADYLNSAKVQSCVVRPLVPIGDDVDYPLGFRYPSADNVGATVRSVNLGYPPELARKYRRPPDII